MHTTRAAWLLMSVIVAGCGWLASAPPVDFSEPAPLTAPWSSLSLPEDGHVITFSDAETLSVRASGRTPDAAMPPFRDALVAAGWVLERDTSSAGVVSQTWARDGQSLSLSIQDRDGTALISLALLPF